MDVHWVNDFNVANPGPNLPVRVGTESGKNADLLSCGHQGVLPAGPWSRTRR